MTAHRHVRIVSQQRVFDGYHALDVFDIEPKSLRHEGYAAQTQREVLTAGDSAFVLLYNPATDEVLLTRQFRMAPFLMNESDPFLHETVAGGIDGGETPEEAAHRETREETGCSLRALVSVGAFFPSPGCLAERCHVYIGCIDAAAAGHYGLEEEGEEIETSLIPFARAMDMLDGGEIRHAITALALHFLSRHHETLRKKWLTT